MVILTAAGAAAVLIWTYLLLGRGRFWQTSRTMAPFVTAAEPARVAAILPARNEASVIARSISSLLETAGEALHVVLVDDASTDGTTQIALQAAARLGQSSGLTVLTAKPLPSGWTGKLWAVSQGIAATREFAPDFLLLTDADIVHSAETIPTLVAIAQAGGYDLVSFMVKLECRSMAEKLLIPAFVFFFFKLYPPAWIADPRRDTAGAAGGCLLIRPQGLERAGGIEAIRSEIIDDCALARAVKRSGGKVWLGMTGGSVSIRPYGSFADIGRMVSRNAFNQLHHSALLLLAAAAGLTLTYLLPPALLFSRHTVPVVLGAAACLAMAVAYWPMIRFYRLNPLWTLTLPAAAVFYLGATIHSAWKFWIGKGGEWKGRAQDRAPVPRPQP